MSQIGLLVNYGLCDNCGKCVEACRSGLPAGFEEAGLTLVPAYPEQETKSHENYYVAIPNDYCRNCWLAHENIVVPVCASACPNHCLAFGQLEELGKEMTEKEQALFSL